MRPRLSPCATVPRIWNGAPRKRRATSTSPAVTSPRMCVEDTISPSISTSSTTRVLERRLGAAAGRRRPWRGGRSGSSPPPRPCGRPRRSTSSRSMNSCALWAENVPSNGITTSSRTPSSAIRSALTASEVSSFGADSGATTVRGCGSKVSTVSAPRITSRWPMCTPSNSPTARWRARGRASGSQVTSIVATRKPTTGLRVPSWRGSAMRDQPVRVGQAHECLGERRRTATPWRRAAGVVGLEAHLGQEAERVGERHDPLLVGVRHVERADRGPPQLEAVGVAEVGDQRADVGARGALDRQPRAVAVAPQQLEARHLDLALGGLDRLAAAGAARTRARRRP